MVRSAQVLRELVSAWENVGEKVADIAKLEHEGDALTHQIIALLNRTFITPFDREDIALLAHSMDDVTDIINAIADALLLYKVESPSHKAKELADALVQITTEVEHTMSRLRNHRTQVKEILSSCVEINRLENVADEIYRDALIELFADTTDIARIIKWREIYEHLEKATDRCEDVANVIEGIALKHA